MTLYKGIFNWYGEVHTIYLHANSPATCRGRMIMKLAKRLGRTRGCVSVRFNGSMDNWRIEEVLPK